MARGLGSRLRRLGVGWLEAGRRRTRARDASIAYSARISARSLRALGGGYGGDSLALGVSVVASTYLSGGYGGDDSLALGVSAVASAYLR